MAGLTGEIFEIAPEGGGCRAHIILRQMPVDLVPDRIRGPFGRASLDRPGPELRGVLALDDAFRFHMAKPHLVVRREDELGVRKAGFQQGAHFAAMPLVDGHQHVVENGESEAFSKQVARSEEHTSELQSLMRISYAV